MLVGGNAPDKQYVRKSGVYDSSGNNQPGKAYNGLTGGEKMNLKNGQITVGEVLSNPNARALLQREYPALINHPMLGMARGMTLNQVLGMARGKVSQQQVNRLFEQLSRI